nr:unnamed protein product [Callosobruchus analis]CAI5826735.1 unnamed protein product [Callosobruchus analis]CAI5832616.1 unnamed protein product [Callosobruchus analis]CAI5839762.1 unnamed protein product [Callosobruchus analis]CAI5869910.1 unnamed protein product [Callosobruchus analis]
MLEDDDEIDELNLILYGLPRQVNERVDNFDKFDEFNFFRRFRVTKAAAVYILSLIEAEIEYPYDINNSVAPMNQLLMFLRLCATGTYLSCIADFSGAHLATVSRHVKRVAVALARLSPRFIRMPETAEEIGNAQHGFYQIARFPRVVGAVDGTHIRIKSPVIRTRNTVERQIGVWKMRFPILGYGCRLKLKTAMNVIVATGVLHNICIENNYPNPPPPEDVALLQYIIMQDEVPNIPLHHSNNVLDVQKDLIEHYFQYIDE